MRRIGRLSWQIAQRLPAAFFQGEAALNFFKGSADSLKWNSSNRTLFRLKAAYLVSLHATVRVLPLIEAKAGKSLSKVGGSS
jgi:hypothetical protein